MNAKVFVVIQDQLRYWHKQINPYLCIQGFVTVFSVEPLLNPAPCIFRQIFSISRLRADLPILAQGKQNSRVLANPAELLSFGLG